MQVLPTVEELWALAAEVDLVVLASPTNVHAAQARAALGRDLPVVVDKPLAVTAADARELAALAEARGVLLTVFHNRRWDREHPTARAVLVRRAGRGHPLRGALRAMAAGAQDPLAREVQQRGGRRLLMDLQPHLVDGALDLFGPAESVYAELAAVTTVGDDVAFLSLRHVSGVTSHLGATSLAAAPGPRMRLIGRQATYLVADVDGDPTAYSAWADPDDRAPRLAGPRRGGRAGTAGPGEPADFYAGVRDALLTGAPPPVTAAEASPSSRSSTRRAGQPPRTPSSPCRDHERSCPHLRGRAS